MPKLGPFSLPVTKFDANVRLGIATGFLGAYTTFSTLCKDTVQLLNEGDYFSAISHISVSTMLGLAAAYFGVILAREVVATRLAKKTVQKLVDTVKDIENEVE